MLDIPALWMFGGKDNTLPVSLSIERLDRSFLAIAGLRTDLASFASNDLGCSR
jgi:hypothetical protein